MRMFPVHSEDIRAREARRRVFGPESSNAPDSVPWEMLKEHEAQAIRNHDQDLETLARRGGLGVQEMLSILDDAHWRLHIKRPLEEAALELNARVKAWHAKRTKGPRPIVGETYRHYKGGAYLVLGIARMSEARDTEVVVYKSLEKGLVWVRPLDQLGQDSWMDGVIWPDGFTRPRFVPINDAPSP